MIGYLEGSIQTKRSGMVVVNVNGVGYLLHCAASHVSGMEIGDSEAFYVETKVSENDIALYGFETEEDQELFVRLTKVQGVGGKSALAVLSALGFGGLCNAVVDEDQKMICQADGVGPKTAVRIINDLKAFAEENAQGILPGQLDPKQVRKVEVSVIAGLMQMGFKKPEADETFKKVISEYDGEPEGLQVGAILSDCLKQLGALQGQAHSA